MRTCVRSLALLIGLRIWCYHELWCRLQIRLRSCVAVAVAQVGSCSSNQTPSLGTMGVALKDQKKKKLPFMCVIRMLKITVSENSKYAIEYYWPVTMQSQFEFEISERIHLITENLCSLTSVSPLSPYIHCLPTPALETTILLFCVSLMDGWMDGSISFYMQMRSYNICLPPP